MTYGAFLLLFVVSPIAILAIIDRRQGLKPWGILAVLSVIALAYTTLWDNYLVANRIWWYAPEQVSGLTIGWVPIEEYAFFLLQPLLTGLWTMLVVRRFSDPSASSDRDPRIRWGILALAGVLWVLSAAALAIGEPQLRYLALILIWILPPMALQFAYGADILWHRWRTVLLSLLPPTIYLTIADSFAISAGIWIINPDTSLPVLLGGILPLEEFVFFLATNCLIVFTVILVAARRPVTLGAALDRAANILQT
jgi:lycopene cyclase domain-containing protein